MRVRLLLAALIASLLFSGVYAVDVNYPFSGVSLKLPPAADPFPGLGTNYSTLAKGMQTVLWNPASLAKLTLAEASITVLSTPGSGDIDKDFKFKESSGSFSATSGAATPAGSYGLFFRPLSAIGTGINTKEVDYQSQITSATTATGINFSSALKINDWLAVGFSTNGPTQTNINMAGDFPLVARGITNLYNQNLSGMEIESNGKLKYTFTSGGLSTTYESTSPLWGGFLTQESTVPLTNITVFRNDLNFQAPYVGTVASKLGNFSCGLNFIPIAASLNINNTLRSMVEAGTSDIFLYTPNFNKDEQSDLATWINDPDKYGTASGYQRKQIKVPAGEIIANGEYRGYYSASTARLDLGTMYEINDWITFGLAFENLNNSTLNFKGSGISSYVNYRTINTSEVSNLSDILQPGGKSTYDIITDSWTTTFEVGGQKLYLDSERNVSLPKKVRLGFAFKKPFLVCLDYEQNQSTFTLAGSDEASNLNISNVNLLRFGLESQLFALPAWLRVGTALMFKPTVSTSDQATINNINNYFKYGVFPVKFDLGAVFNLWGYKLESGVGVDTLPIVNLLQCDLDSVDLNKTSFLTLSLQKDAWQVAYLTQADVFATVNAYYNKPVAAGEKRSFAMSDMKYINSLMVTYRF